MRHRRISKSRLGLHLLGGAVLVACAVVVAHSPSLWRAVGLVAAGTLAAHAGLAIAIHLGLALAGTGVLVLRPRVGEGAARSQTIGSRWEKSRGRTC